MEKVKKHAWAIYLMLVGILVPSMAFAANETVGYSDFESVITNIQGQVSVATVVQILAAAVGIAIGFVFLWWALIKVKNIIMSAWQGRKLRV